MTDLKKLMDELLALSTVEKLRGAAQLLERGADKRIVIHLIQHAEWELRTGKTVSKADDEGWPDKATQRRLRNSYGPDG